LDAPVAYAFTCFCRRTLRAIFVRDRRRPCSIVRMRSTHGDGQFSQSASTASESLRIDCGRIAQTKVHTRIVGKAKLPHLGHRLAELFPSGKKNEQHQTASRDARASVKAELNQVMEDRGFTLRRRVGVESRLSARHRSAVIEQIAEAAPRAARTTPGPVPCNAGTSVKLTGPVVSKQQRALQTRWPQSCWYTCLYTWNVAMKMSFQPSYRSR